MGTVARLNCLSIERTAFAQTVKMQPVVTSDDPRDAEIKAFFAATPSGNVAYSVAPDAVLLGVEPGQQFYLNLRAVAGDPDPERQVVKVTAVRLDGWATHVVLSARSKNGPVWEPWKIELTIRNEVAAEQFQPGGEFYVSLKPAGDA